MKIFDLPVHHPLIMLDFKATQQTTLPKIKRPLTKEALHWHQSLEPAKVVKEYGSINNLDLNPMNNDLLVSSLSRISIYNLNNMEVKKTFQPMTTYSVYWASFRKSDYRLFTASTEEGTINIFDTDNSKPIRILGGDTTTDGHTNPVRCSEFVKHNQVVSFSDDKHVKLWDISDASLLQDIGSDDSITPHNDYVRCGCVIEMNPFLVVSGSYDHTVKVWDTRTKSVQPVHNFTHNQPVEAITSRSSFLACTSAKCAKIYDLIAGKILTTLNNIHSKTTTCARFHEDNLITGSLDGQINIFNRFFSPVTNLSYIPSQILSLAINSKATIVGTVDGLVISRRFKSKISVEEEEEKVLASRVISKNFRYFKNWDEEVGSNVPDDALIVKGAVKKSLDLSYHDKKLKKYDHSRALDLTLFRSRSRPHIVVSMMQELNRRGTLRSALAGREVNGIKFIAKFLIDYVRDPRFSRILVDVAIMFCDIYSTHVDTSPSLENVFRNLHEKINLEISLMKQMMVVGGEIDIILRNSMSH